MFVDAISGPTVLDFCSVTEPESAFTVLSAWFPLLCSQVGQSHIGLFVPASQARPADTRLAHLNGCCSRCGCPLSVYNEGRIKSFRTSKCACLHFHLGSISTPNGLSHYVWVEPEVLNLFLPSGFRSQLCC